MKGKMVLLAGVLALTLGLVGTPASWANSLTYQGFTFGANLDSNQNLVLTITGQGTGNWTGVNSLDAFAISDFGTATGLAVSGWNTNPGGLDSGGCNGNGASFYCFNGNTINFPANAANVSLTITRQSGSFDLTPGPHLKVYFDINGTPCAPGCSLLSQTVPVPGTALMFGLGRVGLLGWHYRSRSQVSRVTLAV